MINVTCAIIIYEGDKILVAQRSEKMSLPLKWEFPGGKIERNETPINCIKREIKEELNIDIEVLMELSPNIYDYGDKKINLIPFLAKYISGEIILSEHKQFKLLQKSELLNIDWAEADIPILNEFLTIEL